MTNKDISVPRERYRTIVVDPPWAYEGFASDPTSGRGLAAEQRLAPVVEPLPYPSMPLDEITALPVPQLAAADCRLFLWTTSRYLPFAFSLLAHWSFVYRQALVWHKTGNPTPFGGSVGPNHAEFILVATRGKPPVLSRWKSSVVAAPSSRRHSAKPEAFLDLVEQVSPGPYLELFARRNRLGWDTWGNEALEMVKL
jgi:N6-adenosine-specific RNA methylase IME4